MEYLEAVATINLWDANFWDERKDILIHELSAHNLDAGHLVILAFQEVRRHPHYPMFEIAEALGFSDKQVFFFPTVISKDYGLGIITNLEVERKHFMFFTHDPTDPLEFGERGIALMHVKDGHGPLVLGVTHLSVSEQMQYIHAFETMNLIKQFAVGTLDIPKTDKKELLSRPLTALENFARILLAGDFNAAPVLPLYELFAEGGLTDLTLPLHKRHPYSWPANVEWFEHLHSKVFGKKPPFDVKSLQRWMDYIWGCGLIPKNQSLLGTKPCQGMYASDHLIPVVYFS